MPFVADVTVKNVPLPEAAFTVQHFIALIGSVRFPRVGDLAQLAL